MALNITTAEFHALAGHEGNEIAFPDLPEPRCRRGFHVSEACLVALKCGYSATPIELQPRIAPGIAGDPGHRWVDVLYGKNADANWNYFQALLLCRGVIECRTLQGNWHAVAYYQGRIFDPDGREFDYSREQCESRGLFTTRLWSIQKVTQ